MLETREGTGQGAPSGAFREVNALRRAGYRLLPGDGFSYLLHLRPREWPIMAGHTAFGFLVAVAAGAQADWGAAVLGVVLFVVFLNGGTLAINSAFDEDEGDIGYLDAPPPPPRGLLPFSVGLMAVGLGVGAVLLPPLFAVTYAACFLMSVLYSVPPFRWKAIGGMDLVINAVGFGTLTPMAGWAISRAPIEPWAAWLLIGFCPLFAALYPLTQLYQVDEDRARGDRTLAIVLGLRPSLLFAIGCTAVAFAMFGVGLGSFGGARPLLLLAFPLLAWSVVLVRWYVRAEEMSSADHKRGMYAALNAWAVTDVAVLAAVFLA